MKRQLPLCVKGDCLCMWKDNHLSAWKGNHLCTWKERAITSVDPGGLWMINAERINIQLSHGKFKRFNLFFLHVGIKTVYITVYNWHREDQQSLHVKRQLPLHVKRWSPLHMKRWSVCVLIAWVDPGGLMINTERINSQLSNEKFKRFNLFFLYVGIKTVYNTVYNAKRINSLCMWKGDCLCMWKGDHLCMCKGDHLCTWKGNCLCLCMWKGDCLCWSWGIDDWCREDQQSTFTWKIQKI